ncbi:MAG: hypothetical protein AAB388_00720 [Patescibacteria group bacterium]
MHRTSQTFSVLQATAAIVGLAIFLWSVGLPSLRFAEAANVSSFSDTLSDSAPTVASDHTIVFTTPTGVANGSTITLDFADGPFVVGSVNDTDIDVATTSDFTLAADCTGSEQASAAFSGTTLTITFCAGDGGSIPTNGTTTIEIGLNATSGGAGNAQLTNPAAGSYEINATAGASDTGSTRVMILSSVTVTASVDTIFTFTVSGVTSGQAVNTADTTGGATTATTIPFGELSANTASTAAQDLAVTTNARNGFVVTVVTDQQLSSTNGADIDSFRNGNGDTVAVAWEAPSETLGDEDTYGHWGVASDDDTLTSGLTNPFNVGSGGDRFVAALTSPVEVFRHTGPADGTGQGEGTTRVGYKVEIGGLQEAASDYTATLTYVATPVF